MNTVYAKTGYVTVLSIPVMRGISQDLEDYDSFTLAGMLETSRRRGETPDPIIEEVVVPASLSNNTVVVEVTLDKVTVLPDLYYVQLVGEKGTDKEVIAEFLLRVEWGLL